MESYPTIDWKPLRGARYIYAFDKLDGSNVRTEWTRKRGLRKFGRRAGLLDDSTPHLIEAADLIQEKYGDDLNRTFRKMRLQRATAFFEFYGEHSFAGTHVEEPHTVTLIDVGLHRQGVLEPKMFLKHFGGLDHATLLHQGKFNREMEEQVRSGTLPGMTFEGVVCKGGYLRSGQPLMFKVKNLAWLAKLRDLCGGDDAMYQRMR